MLRNQKGSVMSVAVIMIAVLSFSLTSITAYTYRTAENTNRITEDHSDSNEAKRIIGEAITLFKEEFETEFENNRTDDEDFQWFEELDSTNNDLDIIDSVEKTFNEEQTSTDNYELSITVSDKYFNRDVDTSYYDSGTARAYRFAYPVSDERDMVKYLFFSDNGVEYEEYEAFTYSIGTSQTLAVNGGQYLDSSDFYGSTLLAGYTPAYKDAEGNYVVQGEDDPDEAAGSYNYPSGEDATFTSPNYRKCEVPALCMSTKDDGDQIDDERVEVGDLIIDESLYDPVDMVDTDYYSDLFLGFKFDDFYNDSINEQLEISNGLDEGSLSIDLDNYETELQTLVNDDTNTITELDKNIVSEGRTLSEDLVWFEDETDPEPMTLNLGSNTLDLNGRSLIVVGDLQIDSVDEIIGQGQIFVYGDINVHNDRDLLVKANLFSTGKIHVNFTGSEENGFTNDSGGQNEGMSLYSKGNILLERNHSVPSNQNARPAILMVTEGSIKIDSAIQWMGFGGAMYALGHENSDGLDKVWLRKDNGDLEPFKGILINSFNGVIDRDSQTIDSTGEPGDIESDKKNDKTNNGQGGGANPGSGKPSWAASPGNSGDGRDDTFSFNSIENSAPGEGNQSNLEESFNIIPDMSRLHIVSNEGDLTTQQSTFAYEDRTN